MSYQPKIVYKYRTWTLPFHQGVLKKNEFFLSSPKDTNDPFDCRIPIDYTLLDTTDKIEAFARTVFTGESGQEYIRINGLDLKTEINKLTILLLDPKGLASYNGTEAKSLFEFQDTNYGILSLSCKWNSILMWSHYSENHKGYCVGLNEDKLKRSDLFGMGGVVNYPTSESFPRLDPLDGDLTNAFGETHTKAADWNYEAEYRLVQMFMETPTTEQRLRKVPDDYFEEIVIGLLTPEAHKKEIIELSKAKRIRIYQAIRVPGKFQLDRQEL